MSHSGVFQIQIQIQIQKRFWENVFKTSTVNHTDPDGRPVDWKKQDIPPPRHSDSPDCVYETPTDTCVHRYTRSVRPLNNQRVIVTHAHTSRKKWRFNISEIIKKQYVRWTKLNTSIARERSTIFHRKIFPSPRAHRSSSLCSTSGSVFISLRKLAQKVGSKTLRILISYEWNVFHYRKSDTLIFLRVG